MIMTIGEMGCMFHKEKGLLLTSVFVVDIYGTGIVSVYTCDRGVEIARCRGEGV